MKKLHALKALVDMDVDQALAVAERYGPRLQELIAGIPMKDLVTLETVFCSGEILMRCRPSDLLLAAIAHCKLEVQPNSDSHT
jgi:hypothetical protein